MLRIFSFFLVFVFLFFGFGTPVSAAEIAPSDVVDFLTYFQYDLIFGNSFYSDLSSPFYAVSNSSRYSYRWECNVTSSFDSFYITILSSTKPKSLSFSPDYNFNNSYSFTYVSSTSAGNGLYRYTYRLDSPPPLKSYFHVRCDFDSLYSGTLAIDSFYGLSSNVVSLRFHKYSFRRVSENKNGDIGNTDSFIWDEFSHGSGYLPSYSAEEEWIAEFLNKEMPIRLDSCFTIPLSSVPLADSAYLSFSAAPNIIGDVGVFLVDNYGMPVATPSFELSTLGMDSNYYNTTFGCLDQIHYSVTVDLTGYDLSGLSLQLNFSVPYVLFSDMEGIAGNYCCLSDCFITVPSSDTTEAWYYPIVKFFSNIFHTILSWIQDIYSTISDGFEAIYTWLDKIYIELAGDPEESVEFEEQTQQNKENLGNLSGDLNSVDKPDINAININVDKFVRPDSINILTSPFNSIFSNFYVFKILSISLILALVSYVLFGKR